MAPRTVPRTTGARGRGDPSFEVLRSAASAGVLVLAALVLVAWSVTHSGQVYNPKFIFVAVCVLAGTLSAGAAGQQLRSSGDVRLLLCSTRRLTSGE